MSNIARSKIGVATYLIPDGSLNQDASISGLREAIDSCIADREFQLVVDLAGVPLLIFFFWYLYDLIAKRREFDEIMAIESRTRFKAKLERADYIAWKLWGDYDARLEEKKKIMRIKD